jgi:hypothetical protein
MKITAGRYLLRVLFFVLVLGGAKTSASVYEIAYNDGIGSFDLTLGSSGPNGSFQVTDIAGTSTLHGIFTLGGVGNDPGYDLFERGVAGR